jgi:hypothetical protein
MALGVTLAATGTGMKDVSGVWVAVIDRCDFGTASRPMRLVLDVTRNENRLKVIEVFNGEYGAGLAEREYALHRSVLPIRSAVGRAKITGRTAVLESRERLDQWRISDDGSELIVDRRIGKSPALQRLIFRRSSEICGISTLGKSATTNMRRSSSVSYAAGRNSHLYA